MGGAIDMTLESHAILINLPASGEGKDLEPARVCQDGSGPLHEIVQTAKVAYEFIARAKIKMVGVCQDKRSANFADLRRRESLNGRLGPYGRKNRRSQLAVRCRENAGAGTSIRRSNAELKHERRL